MFIWKRTCNPFVFGDNPHHNIKTKVENDLPV